MYLNTRRSAAALVALAAVLFLPATLLAQTPDFSGSWVFDATKSVMPTEQRAGRGMGGDMTIKMDAKQLTITRTITMGRGGESREMSTTYVLDGKENTLTSQFGGGSTYTAKWVEGSLVISESRQGRGGRGGGGGGTMTTTSTYSLKMDGKLLVVDSVTPGPNGETKTSMAYNKKM